MASSEKEALAAAEIDIQHTETGAGTIQLDSKNAPQLARTVSATSVPQTPLPDGGLRAWIQVLGCFFLVGIDLPSVLLNRVS